MTGSLSKYFTFSGRATRSEYWWFVLFLFLGSLVAGAIDTSLLGTTEDNGPIAGIFGLATFIPSISAGWRRMHDTGRSGLYLLYPLFAIIGFSTFIGMIGGFETLAGGDISSLMSGGLGIVIVLSLIVIAISPLIVLWWLTRPTQPGTNQFGPNPEEVLP